MSYCKYARGKRKFSNSNGNSYIRKMSRRGERLIHKRAISDYIKGRKDEI